MGAAWAWHAMCESAFTGLSPSTPLCPAIIIMQLLRIHRRSQWPCGVRRGSALDIGERGFESRRWYECLPHLVRVVCCQVEVSASR